MGKRIAKELEYRVLRMGVPGRHHVRDIGKAIAEATGSAPRWSTTYLAVDRMEADGWIETWEEEVDGRIRRYVRTLGDGKRVLRSSEERYTEMLTFPDGLQWGGAV